ncbi:nucleotidyl transferase AbiEii/AbiGii toxin family protein [Patescibacteria group bacterium]|nr:nucleotidyl transferase AbiEii/AbiGii toxin family protein [Patescibacteria group bacterium]MBU1868801.1 nucleotidyl transferase AbiEii/AbiGii toxin family protein [Patescibacteria group bacterium]
MENGITTPTQEAFLSFFANQHDLCDTFYFTGGTALSKYYLQHRFSEDLDFFAFEEFDPLSITPYIHKSRKHLPFNSFDYQQSFNRNMYFLRFDDNGSLKLEFTYFPFKQIESPHLHDGLPVDSLLDIAVNKTFTIAQNPRGRDFFDLYIIMNKQDWHIDELLKKARIKFDWHIDPLLFASQLLKVETCKDDPIIRGQNNTKEISNFFINISKSFSNQIISDY